MNDKKQNVAKKEITIGEGNTTRKVVVYEYLLQCEEDERLEILAGDREISVTPGQEVTFTTSIKNVNRARSFLVAKLCVDLTLEEFDALHPDLRKQLMEQLEELVNVEATKKKLSKEDNS